MRTHLLSLGRFNVNTETNGLFVDEYVWCKGIKRVSEINS
jgi:hypothetical protein